MADFGNIVSRGPHLFVFWYFLYQKDNEATTEYLGTRPGFSSITCHIPDCNCHLTILALWSRYLLSGPNSYVLDPIRHNSWHNFYTIVETISILLFLNINKIYCEWCQVFGSHKVFDERILKRFLFRQCIPCTVQVNIPKVDLHKIVYIYPRITCSETACVMQIFNNNLVQY